MIIKTIKLKQMAEIVLNQDLKINIVRTPLNKSLLKLEIKTIHIRERTGSAVKRSKAARTVKD